MAKQQKTSWMTDGRRSPNDDPGEEIVISGVAGRFPQSNNVKEFAENLYNKKILTTTNHTRYDARKENLPLALGVINNINKFDALFFGVSYKQVEVMDSMSKLLLEHTFEALLDAGINPQSLRGKKTGVFIGCCFSDMEKYMKDDNDTGLGLVGCCRSIFANRISFFLDIHGPSLSVDTACSSSLTALDIAYRAIKSGECDSAIVGGCNTCTEPKVTRMFYNLGVLTMRGACYPFDHRAEGYVRSEAIGVTVLQKAKDAKRVYGTIVYSKANNDGYKSTGLTYPSSSAQYALFEEAYKECDVSPDDISFIEAHATSTKVGDPEEINAIDRFFSPRRTKPLKIGSVKANVGHCEAASGIVSLIKALIAMDTGLIPPNANFEKSRKDCECIQNGRLQVVVEPTPLEEGYVSVDCYGFGGSNTHVILKPNPKKKSDKRSEENSLPKLVVISGRTEEAVESFLNDIANRPVDVEYIRLLHDIFTENISSHFYRGYIITGRQNNDSPIRAVEKYEDIAKSVWFAFSGMGSQWPGMGTSLMRFPAFAKAIQNCDAVLKPRGLDIMDILTNTDKHNFDNILRSFVGITAVQIGLVDILTAAGIVPDKLIGHSVGELGCAYADGCFTAEEAILAAYSRGLASIETELLLGSMAAIGIGYNQIKDMCPSDIEVACHNGPESSTISGPKKSVEAFVAQLQAKGVFAREVATSNIAYHSKYIAPAGKKLLSYLRDVIKEPKPRSGKWLSTSVPRAQWSSPQSKLSSAEYHTNNLLSPVLFEETITLIPKNAIVIEIGSYGLLQAILKRSLDESVLNVSLGKRNHKNNAEILLETLGKLYNVGLQLQLVKLYPEVELPVSRGTPMISPLVKWEHSDDCRTLTENEQTSGIFIKDFNITPSSHLGRSMAGHIIDGRHLVPATAYLILVWEACSAQADKEYESIVFEDVTFNRGTIITETGKLQFTVTIEDYTGRFQIIESKEAVVTGTVRVGTDTMQEWIAPEYLPEAEDLPEEMDTKDVYKELRIRGYHYAGEFRGIKSSTITGMKGHLAWNGNWISFLDTILQMHIFQYESRRLLLPTRFKELAINVRRHEMARKEAADASLPVIYYKNIHTAVCGGVIMRNLIATVIPRRPPSRTPILDEYKFVAHRDLSNISLVQAVILSVNLALENICLNNVQTVEFLDERDNVKIDSLLSPIIVDVLRNIPMVRSTSLLISSASQLKEKLSPAGVDVVGLKELPQNTKAMIAFGYDLLARDRKENLMTLMQLVEKGCFLVSFENGDYTDQYARNFNLDIIMEKRVNQKRMVLLKVRSPPARKIITISLKNNEFSWIEDMKEALKAQEKYARAEKFRVVLIGEGFENGLLGFLNCLRREPGGQMVTGILIQDENAPKFSLDDPFYGDQLKLHLVVNVLQRNVWGSYRHLPLPPTEPKIVPYAAVYQKIIGDLRSFSWTENSIEEITSRGRMAYIYYCAVNFRDVMTTTAKLQDDGKFLDQCDNGAVCFEFSGKDEDGNRVMGLTSNRACANLCRCDEIFTFLVPNEWTLEDAATVPCAYATSYYAFYLVGKIQRGHKVLIHSGSGAVGQAAIHIALQEGCEVFTTVGTPEKRKFIRSTFPAIDDDHIGNSRDTTFELMVLKQTKGRGVDIVLNSLAGEKLHASLRCLAENGQFLEIGKFDMITDSKLGMASFSKGVTFLPILLDTLFFSKRDEQGNEMSQILKTLLNNGINKGVVKPLVRTVFGKDQVETAFRYMAAGKHIGKVMIKIRNEEDLLDGLVLAYPQYYSKKGGVYVIFGGLGGIGLELTDWLILRGAKNLVLISRDGVKNGYQRRMMKIWESKCVKILIVSGKDVTNKKDVESILKNAARMGVIDGIFNLAVTLKDAICVNQTKESFEESFKTKAWLAKILDELTRKMCPHLRHFVMFSSVSSGKGNAGQCNYGMSNSVMERICEKRVQDGLPGIALQWGAIGDVGLVADMQEGRELVIGGTLQQGIQSCLEVLNDFLLRDCAIVSSIVVAEKSVRKNEQDVVEAVQSIMGLKDLKRINMSTTLPELGVDSMTVVEIKEILEREYDIFLTAQQIRNLNFAKLVDISKNSTKYRPAVKGKVAHGGNKNNLDHILNLTVGKELQLGVCVELSTMAEANRPIVYFVPGIEGTIQVFYALAAHVKSPGVCLQLDLSAEKKSHESITETANSLLPYVLSRNKGRKNFVLVGYSFGTMIAIEIARKMELMGFSGHLILIDGSPIHMKLSCAALFTENEEENQNLFVIKTLNNYYPTNNTTMETELRQCKTFEEKVRVALGIIKTLKPDDNVPPEFRMKMFEILYARKLSIESYDISQEKPIKTPITLLKPTDGDTLMVEEDYGLSKITEGTVKTHYLEGNHYTIIKNTKVAEIINDLSTDDTTI